MFYIPHQRIGAISSMASMVSRCYTGLKTMPNSCADDPLSCSIGLTCVNSGEALGCCTSTTGICTALYTTCANYQNECDQLCSDKNIVCNRSPMRLPRVLLIVYHYSDALEPFCGTYAFPGDTSLFDCMVSSMPIQDVEF